ncbi:MULTISPECIES: LysR family transcriptional regulator [unclassified Pseudomonas]|uniref:LysR family transcriptional regulator n=1 Tax=unclassified Pseudomonas TaxID=196821 RepID=UPI0030D6F64D
MTMTRLPHLNLLQAFKTVADQRSFSRAAETLHLTQSAVSQQVVKLEEVVGVPLFVRSTRSTELTEDGAQLLIEISSPLTSLIQAFEKFSRPNKIPVLHFECEPVLSSIWITPRLKSFTECFGAIYFQQRLTTQNLEFSPDTQFAIKWGTGKRPGYVSEYLLGLNYIPMCSPALIEGRDRLTSPSQLNSLPLLHDRDRGDWTTWLKVFDIEDVNPNEGHVVNDANVLMHMAIEGHGVALCAMELCEKPLKEGVLVLPFPEMSMPHNMAYYILTRATPPPSARAIQFIEWLKSEVKKYRGGTEDTI